MRNIVEGLRLAVWAVMVVVGMFLGALIIIGLVLAMLVFLLVAI